MEGRREPEPLRNMDASVLVKRLDNHSDIDATTLTALACVSKPFKEAVDSVWPARQEAYVKEREKAVVEKRKALPLPGGWEEKYPSIYEACRYEVLYRLQDNGEMCATTEIVFEWDEEDSDWCRQTALMTGTLARQAYFLDTTDLGALQPYRSESNQRFFRFEDVLAAAMLRYGRAALREKMGARASKMDARGRILQKRWSAVWEAVNAEGEHDNTLTMSVAHAYAQDFVKTGRGGIRGFLKRLQRHRFFSFAVSCGVISHVSLHLSPVEQSLVSHLQLGYVLTQRREFIEDAKRVIRGVRGL
jgi:hypothetical protein